MNWIVVFLAAQAAAAAPPVDAVEPARRAESCLPVQAVVPPFNNTREAMDQARMAAGYVRGAERRHPPGDAEVDSDDRPLCGGDWIADASAAAALPPDEPATAPEDPSATDADS